MLKRILTGLNLHPRAWVDALLTYPRFIGTIKPELMRGAAHELAPRLAMHQAGLWPKQLAAPVARRILAISPHPDDESIGCGGFLLAHAETAEIRILNVYNGDGGGALEGGPWRNDPGYRRRLVSTRARELDQAAHLLRASSVVRLGVSDCDGVPGSVEVAALRKVLHEYAPDVVVLPWFLDKHPHHRSTNAVFAEAAQGLETMVLGYEVWGLLTPNAYFDITGLLDRKLELIACHASQVRTVDYLGYASGLARMRAFHHAVGDRRSGAAEAFVAFPCRDYCDLVRHAGP